MTVKGGWSVGKVALVVGALALATALSVTQGLHERLGQDFHVFWQAGRNFTTGHPLYHDSLPGARPLKYPPFAAFVFQPLALFPLQVAAALFSFLNLVLWALAVWLTRDIVARTFPDRNPTVVPLVIAVILSAQFFLDNFHHAQMNGVILVLVLLGIRAYLRGRDVRAAAYTVAATAIKITPVFFVAWLVLRGRRRAALAVAPIALACILVPLVLRGPATGAAELVEYYHTFLEGHQHGEIDNYTGGQNLAAFVNRMTRPVENARHVSYRYLPLSEPAAQAVYRSLWAAVLLIFLARLALLRRRGRPVSALELAMVFLAGLLLSPITFTTHLVSLLFVFCVFLSVRPAAIAPAARPLAVLLCVAIAVIGLSGRDLAGSAAYEAVGGYSLYVWTMLLLFATAVVAA
jgi:alpha-1,2-mannosyltransferase